MEAASRKPLKQSPKNSFLFLQNPPKLIFCFCSTVCKKGLILLSHSLHLAQVSFQFVSTNCFLLSSGKSFPQYARPSPGPCFRPSSERSAPLQSPPAVLRLDPSSRLSRDSAWISVIHELYGCNFILPFLTSLQFPEAHE